MKVVVYTQIRENYGAHDWDGQGECPQYWKFKGGNTYVVHNVTVAQAQDAAWWDALYAAIESLSEGFEEYVISADPVDECDFDESKICEEWESPINLVQSEGKFLASRYTKADSYWQSEVAAKLEQWVQVGGGRDEFKMFFEMKDSRLLTYQEWVAQQEAA